MSSKGEYYDWVWLEATLLDQVGGNPSVQLSGSPIECVLRCYFFNYFGFPATIHAKAFLPQRKTGLIFERTGNSDAPIEVSDLQPADFEELHEKLIARHPKPGTERIAVVVESYEDRSTGALGKPSAAKPIGLKLSIIP